MKKEPECVQKQTRFVGLFTVLMTAVLGVACSTANESNSGSSRNAPLPPSADEQPLDPGMVAQGKEIFRYDTFGDEVYWTDTLRMHEVIERVVSPATALKVGLKVDADALPQEVKAAIAEST
jgi:hypothetical protein